MLLGGERLRLTTDATTVQVRDGQVLVADGQFAETKEQMGGYPGVRSEWGRIIATMIRVTGDWDLAEECAHNRCRPGPGWALRRGHPDGPRVAELMPDEPEVSGLVSLMLLHHSKRSARADDTGALVPLEEQDRTRWDADAIAEAIELLRSGSPPL